MWLLQPVDLTTDPGPLARRESDLRRRLGRGRSTAPQDPREDSDPTGESQARDHPRRDGPRRQQDRLSVLVDEERLDLIGSLTVAEAAPDLTAHRSRRVGWRVR